MSICASVGKPVITDIDVCIHDGFVVFERQRVLQDFLYHSLKALESGWSKSGQTGSQMNLNTGIINPTRIPLPPTKAEQEAIAEALSDADVLIESLERLIAQKRQIKQGAMQELLTGKKRLFGFKNQKGFTRCELGLVPKDWQCMQLPSLTVHSTSSIKIGPFGSALKKEYLTKDGFKVYGQENVYEKNMDTGHRFINSEHFRKLRSCEIKAGDFLISMMGTVGKCMIVPNGIKDGIMDSHLLRLRLDSGKLCLDFLAQLFETKIVFDQVKQLSVGGIMEGLSSKIIRSIKLPVPTVEEQASIAKVLTDMDAEIASLEEKLAKTRAIKQGMMHNLLTGKVRLIDPAIVKVEQHTLSDVKNIIPAALKPDKSHNWAFNEAVVISVLADLFVDKPEFPLGRKRYTKLSYLMHRKAEQEVQGYLKKAAGPEWHLLKR